MTEGGERKPGPGYQGSERSSADLTIYPQKGDPILVSSIALAKIAMANAQGYDPMSMAPALVSLNTAKSMGAASGTWTATIKPPRNPKARDPLSQIVDDDWVDIVFKRHGKVWHVMRGLIDEVRVNKSVGGSGATVRTYTITGRDFGSIFERTNIWFSPYTDEMITGGLALKVFGGEMNVYGKPGKVVDGFLFGFMRELAGVGRAVWKIPSSVPTYGGLNFAEALNLDAKGVLNEPGRIAINPNYMMPEGNIWQLAQEWSDPAFCELFCDTLPPGPSAKVDDELTIGQTLMKVILRDRPFPVVDGGLSPNGMASPYFSLPLHIIPVQAVVSSNLGRSGTERFNSFHLSPQIAQELTGVGALDLVAPLWSPDDILHHGMRRYDIQTHYVSEKAELLTLSKAQRTRIRDWHCIDSYLLNGTINLGRGFPEIRIGERVRLVGPGSPQTDQTFYVEQVSHNWQFGGSIKTSLGVTRGWTGDDNSYLTALTQLTSKYKEARKGKPSQVGISV